MISPEQLASAYSLSDLRLSHDASWLVYVLADLLTPSTSDHKSSSLWLAQTNTSVTNARKITSGDTHDWAPLFHPLSSDIYYLSDRAKRGGSPQIYCLPLSSIGLGHEPVLVTPVHEKFNIKEFDISPDGAYIVFRAVLESSKPDAPKVWRDKSDLASLYVIDLRAQDKSVSILVSVDAHVATFAWSSDSSSIVFRLQSHADEEARFEAVIECIVSVSTKEVREVHKHARMPRGLSIWTDSGDLVFTQGRSPENLSSASVLWMLSTTVAQGQHSDTKNNIPRFLHYGIHDDCLGALSLQAGSQYVTLVVEGLATRLDVFDSHHNLLFTLFETSREEINAVDVRLTASGRYVFAVISSSSVSASPPNVWIGSAEKGKTGTLTTKLSDHTYEWLIDDSSVPLSSVFEWTSVDGEKIQAVHSYPKNGDLKLLPTVIVPHGGPYSRDALGLTLGTLSIRLFLASHGYSVLSPNYRGSMGRGDTFAAAANGGMGKLDWADIETMISEAVHRGLADESRIGIAGWSQGGFLAAWGCTRPNSVFKVGVIGAGVTDWGMLAATSDLPDMEAGLGGGATWDDAPGIPAYLQGSPIKDVHHVRVPLLLLHGQDDPRVPVSQAISFLRGVERKSKLAPDQMPTLVIYPGEGHDFSNEENVIDKYKRLLGFLDRYLK